MIIGLFIKPFISVFRTLPTLAVILILLCWTTPVVAPTAVTVLVLFPMIYSQINTAVSGIDGGIIDMAKVYKITEKEKLAKIYLPMIAPSILAQTGANISLGIKVMIPRKCLPARTEVLAVLCRMHAYISICRNLQH